MACTKIYIFTYFHSQYSVIFSVVPRSRSQESARTLVALHVDGQEERLNAKNTHIHEKESRRPAFFLESQTGRGRGVTKIKDCCKNKTGNMKKKTFQEH